jgi:hypothetical protein
MEEMVPPLHPWELRHHLLALMALPPISPEPLITTAVAVAVVSVHIPMELEVVTSEYQMVV